MTTQPAHAAGLIPTEYELIIYRGGNVLTGKMQVQLLAHSTMETFDLPFRESSNRHLRKLTGFGSDLILELSKIGGVVSIQVLLYEFRISLGGLFDQKQCLTDTEQVLKNRYEWGGYYATGSTKVLPMPGSEKKSIDLLPLRLQMMRQLGRKKLRN